MSEGFKNRFLVLVSVVTAGFFASVSWDIFPLLRGPAPYPPEWQWDYLFVNTLNKLWAPLLVTIIIFGMYLFVERHQKFAVKHIYVFLICAALISYMFQMGVLYFSRAGIGVLIHRIINPELNGYFTASLNIKNVYEFVSTYNENVLSFVYHAASHPPGAILFFYFNNLFASMFPAFIDYVDKLSPSRPDVRLIWVTLEAAQKAGAVFSAFFIPMLASFTVVPLYFAASALYGVKIALRTIFIYIFIPSAVLFIPINDSFLPIFSITSFLFFYKGIKENKKYYLFLSGLTLFVGVFFNLSLLTIGVLFMIFYLLNFLGLKLKPMRLLIDSSVFAGGFLLLPILLLVFFNFNFYEMTRIIMTTVTHVNSRSYSLWLWYNAVDFFIFAGIPLSMVFFYKFIRETKFFCLNVFGRNFLKNIRKLDFVFIAFLMMLIIVNFSGSIRGEGGRILVVFMPFMALIGAGFLTKSLRFTRIQFCVFLFFQAMQILVMHEFWVMLW